MNDPYAVPHAIDAAPEMKRPSFVAALDKYTTAIEKGWPAPGRRFARRDPLDAHEVEVEAGDTVVKLVETAADCGYCVFLVRRDGRWRATLTHVESGKFLYAWSESAPADALRVVVAKLPPIAKEAPHA